MMDLINPGRELIKEGKIIRISAKDGDHIERYLFLVCGFYVSIFSSMEDMLSRWSAESYEFIVTDLL